MDTKFLILAVVVAISCPLSATLKIPSVIGNNMMLQRDKTVLIWGKGDVNSTVSVTFAGQSQQTICDAVGQWQVKLKSMSANTNPQDMTIRSGSEMKTIKNILVGDIWIYSGQSNMEFPLFKSTHGNEALKHPANPQLRLFRQRFMGTSKPQFDVFQGHWKVDSPDARKWTSAVAYHFINEIYKKEQVPVALIHACIGGSNVAMWTPLKDIKSMAQCQWYIKKYQEHSENYDRNKREHEASITAGQKVKISEHYGWFPTATYNAMIHPIQNFTTKGVIWYQGEADTNDFAVKLYHQLFSIMIRAWRREMQDPKLPFLYVQLPLFDAPDNTSWPKLREAQAFTTRDLGHTGMVVSFDTGDQDDVHPPLKKPVGERLAKLALKRVYGHDIEDTAPTYESFKVVGNTIELTFTNMGAGFETHDGEMPREFVICGADQKFVPANARIIDHKILISSPDISKPVAVRYGWKDLLNVNLFGKNGLPVGPFRTDEW